jgi:hypothetical protein
VGRAARARHGAGVVRAGRAAHPRRLPHRGRRPSPARAHRHRVPGAQRRARLLPREHAGRVLSVGSVSARHALVGVA